MAASRVRGERTRSISLPRNWAYAVTFDLSLPATVAGGLISDISAVSVENRVRKPGAPKFLTPASITGTLAMAGHIHEM